MKSRLATWSLVCCALAVTLFSAGLAHSAPITLGFTGTIDSTFFDPSDPFGGTIGFGTAFAGTYTFESTTPDAIPDSSVGSYSNFGAPFGMTVDIGGNLFGANEFLNIGVADDIGAGVDQYTVLAQEGTPFVTPSFLSMQIFLEDSTGTALMSDLLPLSALDVNDFDSGSFFLDGTVATAGGLFQFQLQGTIDELSSVSIPSPSPLVLLGAGWLSWWATARSRRRTKRSS